MINHREPLVDQVKALGLEPRYVASLNGTEGHFPAIVELIKPICSRRAVGSSARTCSTALILEEEKYLLENLAGFETIYWGDHGNNIVSSKGRLPASRELFLGKIDHAIASHPVTAREVLLTSSW